MHENCKPFENDGSQQYIFSEESFEEVKAPESEQHYSSISIIKSAQVFAGLIVTDLRFKRAVILCILINSIVLGIGTFSFVVENPSVQDAFDTIDRIFLVLFTIELSLQFLHCGWNLLSDGWMAFDVFLVGSSWFLPEMQVARAFRILRAARVVTNNRDLKGLVAALASVIPRMFSIVLLLLIVFYVFGVMFTMLFRDTYKDGYTSEDYFSRLDRSFFTLFQLMTLDSWSQLTKELMALYGWAWLPIMSFIMISSFIIINLFIAVICDAVSQLEAEEMVKIERTLSKVEQGPEDMRRLEEKIDSLTNNLNSLSDSVKILMESHRALQESMKAKTN